MTGSVGSNDDGEYWTVHTRPSGVLRIPWSFPESRILYDNTIAVKQTQRIWHIGKGGRKDMITELFKLYLLLVLVSLMLSNKTDKKI